jgi:Prp8 binding protein
VYGECSNYNVLSGHKNAVLQVKWSPGENTSYIASCSADKTVCVWDANKGARIRKYSEHTGIVNACSFASSGLSAKADSSTPHLLCSGSDDSSVLTYDVRAKWSVARIPHPYQVCMHSSIRIYCNEP